MNIWDCYRLGVKLRTGLWQSKKRFFLNLIKQPASLPDWLTPIDYVRYREFDFVLRAIHHYKPTFTNVLDIGSPQLLPMTLAYYMSKASVHTVDIFKTEIKYKQSAAFRLDLKNLVAEVQDARVLGYSEGQFGLITSVSVFEHITPERDGDILAARELGRVLASGGIAIITVPFATSRFVEYRDNEVYDRAFKKKGPIFFQRFYDQDLLNINIIKASGLKPLFLGFIEERFFYKNPHKRLAHYISGSSLKNKIFGPWFPLLSHIFLSSARPLEVCQKPYIACLVLKKSS